MDEFSRRNLKTILHLITGELKLRGTKTPHVFLPFRSRIDDHQLELFLQASFPGGTVASEEVLRRIVKEYDEFTLMCAMKYLWSRLPNHEIIGWDVYLEFKRKEEEQGFPRTAFLTIMPKCLSSPSHASIVYDFLDLLVSIASNSQYNYLSGRKIAKMSSLWAFNPARERMKSAFYDATIDRDHSFIDGLDRWKQSSGALFHLLLSFLRAMLPENDMDTLKLPKTLQSLLISNSYPPLANNDSVKSMIKIPCVLLKSTKPSENVYELLSKVRRTIKFDKKDDFMSVENYTILKNIFKKDSTADIVASLSEESRRIMGRLTDILDSSDYDLYPGWAPFGGKVDENIPLFTELTIQDVTIQDYYIWTWLSSLGSDQHSIVKRNFGRSLIAEVEVLDQRKWIVVSEQILSTEDYLKKFETTPTVPPKDRIISNGSHKDMPLPPPPPPLKDADEPLPKYYFGGGSDAGTMDKSTDDDYNFPDQVQSDELDEYKKYLESLNDSDDETPTKDFAEKLNLKTHVEKKLPKQPKKHRHRPPPPDSPVSPVRSHAAPGGEVIANPTGNPAKAHPTANPAKANPAMAHPTATAYPNVAAHPNVTHSDATAHPNVVAHPNHTAHQNYTAPNLNAHEAPTMYPQQVMPQPEPADYQNNYNHNPQDYRSNEYYSEPYETYSTPNDHQDQPIAQEPFENYHVPVEEHGASHIIPNDQDGVVVPVVQENIVNSADHLVQPPSAPGSPDTKEKKRKKKKKKSRKNEEPPMNALVPTGFFPPGPPPNFMPEGPEGSYFPPYPTPMLQEPLPETNEHEKRKKKSKRKDASVSPIRENRNMAPPQLDQPGNGQLITMTNDSIPTITAPMEEADQPPLPPSKDTPRHEQQRARTPEHLRPRSKQQLTKSPNLSADVGLSPTLTASGTHVTHQPQYTSNLSPLPVSMAPPNQGMPGSDTVKLQSLSPLPRLQHHGSRPASSSPQLRLQIFFHQDSSSRGPSPQHAPQPQQRHPPHQQSYQSQEYNGTNHPVQQKSAQGYNSPNFATPMPQGPNMPPPSSSPPMKGLHHHQHKNHQQQAPLQHFPQQQLPQQLPQQAPQQLPQHTPQHVPQQAPQQIPQQALQQVPHQHVPQHGHPQSYSPVPQGYPQRPPQSYSYGPQQGYNPAPPQGYAPDPSQGYSQGPVQNYPQGPQGSQGPPQGYSQPPPQGYAQPPPQGYHPGPPQGHAQNIPPAMPQPYQQHPQQPGQPPYNQQSHPGGFQQQPAPYGQAGHQRPPRNTAGDLAMMNMPQSHKHHKNQGTNKASLRAAFNQGSFGI